MTSSNDFQQISARTIWDCGREWVGERKGSFDKMSAPSQERIRIINRVACSAEATGRLIKRRQHLRMLPSPRTPLFSILNRFQALKLGLICLFSLPSVLGFYEPRAGEERERKRHFRNSLREIIQNRWNMMPERMLILVENVSS
jgi:hypothetical protein